MATTTKKLNLSNIHAVLGDIHPELTRTDNKIMQINGHPCEIFLISTVTTTESNLNVATKLVGVRGGVVINMTDDTTLAMAITPLNSNAATAVINGILPADKTFILVVYGTEIQ